ncbi:MAG: hypothetical protein E6R03_14215 [Hyphomicrobiaceae bacterium]|nr:MAG: hypothetical protein E6R03_14215 [Hyphomicrobiaceae bacterium]
MNLVVLSPLFSPLQAVPDRIQENCRKFANHMDSFGVPVHYLDCEPDTGLWQKERLINHAVANLPAKYDAIAWIDADLTFMNEQWVLFTEANLQQRKVVQLFSDVIRLESNGSIQDGPRKSAVRGWLDRSGPDPASPGYAWAARRELFDHGGLYDADIVGGGDSAAFHGWAGRSWNRPIAPAQQSHYEEWLRRSNAYVQGSIGYVDGLILHHWHGDIKNRQYNTRYNILQKHGFDPLTHLRLDPAGHWTWSAAAPVGLVNDVREYFRARRDDG